MTNPPIITNIHYDYNDKLCVIADVMFADITTVIALEWIENGKLVTEDSHLDANYSEDFVEGDAEHIRAELQKWVSENPTPEFSCIWRSADSQGILSGEECTNKESIIAGLATFKAELLDGCANDEEREGILTGAFVISHPVVVDDVRHLR